MPSTLTTVIARSSTGRKIHRLFDQDVEQVTSMMKAWRDCSVVGATGRGRLGVLLGDSHLARIKRELPRLGENVVNAAVGGTTVHDLDAQADAAAVGPDDVVVLSIGTNDAAPWKEMPSELFGQLLERFLSSRCVGRWVMLLPPGVVEIRVKGSGDRTNALLEDYRAAATAAATSAGAGIIDTRGVLSALDSSAFASDGLHLSGEGYRALLPALLAATSAKT